MDRKVKIQAIGNYLEPLERMLRNRNIFLDDIISHCHPLAMTGPIDDNNLKYCNDIRTSMPAILNIRKNLSQMLSHDPENYCSNYYSTPVACEVKYKNDCEYVMIMNTGVGYTLFEKNGIIYSDTWPQSQLVADIKNDPGYKRIHFPFTDDFNWKYYYDQFIDAILSEYDREHIILIRVNSARWYMQGKQIADFGIAASQFRKRIEQMDEYFIYRTRCLCIDEHFNYIPPKKEACVFPYARMGKFAYGQIKKCIEEIVEGKKDQYRPKIYHFTNPLAKSIAYKLSSEIVNQNINSLERIENEWILADELEAIKDTNSFFQEILKIKKFLFSDEYSFSDYASDLLKDKGKIESAIDFEMMEIYTRYMKLNINDIISVYLLSKECTNKTLFKRAVNNIISNRSCLPVIASKKFVKKNIEYLKNYPYICPDFLNEYVGSKIYIYLENNIYICLDNLSEDPITAVDAGIQNKININDIISNDYTCTINQASALCSDLAFYIERAKRGHGNRPLTVEFSSVDDFNYYINIIDYPDILESEKFVIKLADKEYKISEYEPICDLSFLLKGNVKLCVMGNGFYDQTRFYIFAKILQERTGCDMYFDDIYGFYYRNDFNGAEEIKRVVKENIEERFLSNLFSEKLLESCCEQFSAINADMQSMAVLLYKNGLNNIFTFTQRKFTEGKCPTIMLRSCGVQFDMRFLDLFKDDGLSHYWILGHYDEILKNKKYTDYIQFPPFEDEENIMIEKEMLACDAVVIHIRRGDYINFLLGNKSASDENYTNYNFFVEAVQKLMALDDYPNKKYFIFSDDIPWCKNNLEKIGLGAINRADIFFVDHNKGSYSYRDMQLMMNGKIMIISHSGFAKGAAFLNERCEVLMSIRGRTMNSFIMSGKKYKYNMEPFTNSRGTFENWI